jgi:hypothetical protein
MNTEPKASDLLIATFDVPPDGIYVERNGVATRGKRPDWLGWPSVRGDEIAREAWNPKAGRE